MTTEIKGIAASSGIVMAKAFRLDHPKLTIEKTRVSHPEAEVLRFEGAVADSITELKHLKEHVLEQLGAEEAKVFAAHILVLSDPDLVDTVKNKIKEEQVNAEYALNEVGAGFVQILENMANAYTKERAADIRDVMKRVLFRLSGLTMLDPAAITEEVVIIAEDLTPSETAQLNRRFVKGFATDIGGRTSHSAIMARSMEIPAVVGTGTATANVKTDDIVILDGWEGKIIVNPSTEFINMYKEKKASHEAQKAAWAKLAHQKTASADGHGVKLTANIARPDEVSGVIEHGGEGVGLYRTEFLYMGRDTVPNEEEQLDAYRSVLERMNGKPVIFRTLDIGGDKDVSYLNLPREANPFLGYRAIRLCLDRQDLFRTQLRALLRASVYGELKIMFPMIATLDELIQAKSILLEEKNTLRTAGVAVSDEIEVGMMVEIPAVAVMADLFAKEVDFFSIGTNDLIQYTFAADRMNERISYLYQPYNPAILRLIKNIIDAAHHEGIWVGMCGEMAGDEIAIPLLLGLGLDEFSMSATSILKARSQIRTLSKTQIVPHLGQILSMRTSDEVLAYMKQTFHA